MGIFHVISSCSCKGRCSCSGPGHTAGGIKTREDWRESPNPVSVAPRPSAPNPGRFEIERLDDMGSWTMIMVRYLDATNYEGRKILVYRHPAGVVRSQTNLDPHFCDQPGCISPFARFEPTEDGWLAGYLLVKQAKLLGMLNPKDGQ